MYKHIKLIIWINDKSHFFYLKKSYCQTSIKMDTIKRKERTNVDKVVEKLEHLCIADRNVK